MRATCRSQGNAPGIIHIHTAAFVGEVRGKSDFFPYNNCGMRGHRNMDCYRIGEGAHRGWQQRGWAWKKGRIGYGGGWSYASRTSKHPVRGGCSRCLRWPWRLQTTTQRCHPWLQRLQRMGRGKTMESQTLTLAPFSDNSPNCRPYDKGRVGSLGCCR